MITHYELRVRLQFDDIVPGRLEATPGKALEAVPVAGLQPQAKALTIHLCVNSEASSGSRRMGLASFVRGVDRAAGLIRRILSYMAYIFWY